MSEVENFLSNLNGKPVWGACRTNGSSFFVQIGQPRLRTREALKGHKIDGKRSDLSRRRIWPVGEYELFIIDCFWMIVDGTVSYGDELDEKSIDSAISLLNGGYIESVKKEKENETVIQLDSDIQLRVRENPEFTSTGQWNITDRDDQTWAMCGDGSVR